MLPFVLTGYVTLVNHVNECAGYRWVCNKLPQTILFSQNKSRIWVGLSCLWHPLGSLNHLLGSTSSGLDFLVAWGRIAGRLVCTGSLPSSKQFQAVPGLLIGYLHSSLELRSEGSNRPKKSGEASYSVVSAIAKCHLCCILLIFTGLAHVQGGKGLLECMNTGKPGSSGSYLGSKLPQ